MASTKPCFTFRTDREILQKLNTLAETENRTANKQLEYILINYIKTYEAEHGEIKKESD